MQRMGDDGNGGGRENVEVAARGGGWSTGARAVCRRAPHERGRSREDSERQRKGRERASERRRKGSERAAEGQGRGWSRQRERGQQDRAARRG